MWIKWHREWNTGKESSHGYNQVKDEEEAESFCEEVDLDYYGLEQYRGCFFEVIDKPPKEYIEELVVNYTKEIEYLHQQLEKYHKMLGEYSEK